jgi:hypothetical protein
MWGTRQKLACFNELIKLFVVTSPVPMGLKFRRTFPALGQSQHHTCRFVVPEISLKASIVVSGLFCAVACIAAVCVYAFDFANRPLSSESTFWAMPMICPAAYGIYLKSKQIGAVSQAILYALATVGAYQMIDGECGRDNCSTHNPVAIFIASMFSGVHMLAMLAALILMCIGAVKTFRTNVAA